MEPKIKAYIEAQLRRIFGYTQATKIVKKRCLIEGNLFKCEGCASIISKRGLDSREYLGSAHIYAEGLYIDHIQPVCPVEGWENITQWKENIIKRLIVPADMLQYLCQSCHYIKTQIENDERRENKRSRDGLK